MLVIDVVPRPEFGAGRHRDEHASAVRKGRDRLLQHFNVVGDVFDHVEEQQRLDPVALYDVEILRLQSRTNPIGGEHMGWVSELHAADVMAKPTQARDHDAGAAPDLQQDRSRAQHALPAQAAQRLVEERIARPEPEVLFDAVGEIILEERRIVESDRGLRGCHSAIASVGCVLGPPEPNGTRSNRPDRRNDRRRLAPWRRPAE